MVCLQQVVWLFLTLFQDVIPKKAEAGVKEKDLLSTTKLLIPVLCDHQDLQLGACSGRGFSQSWASFGRVGASHCSKELSLTSKTIRLGEIYSDLTNRVCKHKIMFRPIRFHQAPLHWTYLVHRVQSICMRVWMWIGSTVTRVWPIFRCSDTFLYHDIYQSDIHAYKCCVTILIIVTLLPKQAPVVQCP